MEEIKELLQEPTVTILDVRNPDEFAADSIAGAINIPLSEVGNRIEEIKQMSTPIVVHCLMGGRSASAVGILKQAGLSDVYNGGGIATMKSLLS